MGTTEERLATLEEQANQIPHIRARVDDIWSWVNQQKGAQSQTRHIVPFLALGTAIVALLKGG